MNVLCKSCKRKIAVSGKPGGSTNLSGVQVTGDVKIQGGGIAFGPGGGISFGPGGGISFGPPPKSEFVCTECGHIDTYGAEDFIED
jgi:hypothetical protein